VTSGALYEEFLDATRQVCEDLGINPRRIKLTRFETEHIGITYIAEGSNKTTRFVFDVKTEAKGRDLLSGTMDASMEICYDKNASPFFLSENIDYMRVHQPSLPRWAAWAVFNFNLKHNPVNLESLFNEMPLRVYGLPRLTYPGLSEVRLLIGGLEKFHKGKILIYKFRHVIDSRYRAFSYAFLVGTTYHYYWGFFPELGGMDSGGWSIALKETESLIKRLSRKKKVEVRRFDIDCEQFEEFLKNHADGFPLSHEFAKPDPPSLSEELFGSDFIEASTKFEQRYESKDYSQALRDLRALVQEAQEIVLKKKLGRGAEREDSVAKLGNILVDNKIVDESMRHWFAAFASVANHSSHKSYPSKTEIEDYDIRNRIMLTFEIGRQLILELSKIMEPPKPEVFEILSVEPSEEMVIPAKPKKLTGKQLHEETIGLPSKLKQKRTDG
jgi:hypothetical protein